DVAPQLVDVLVVDLVDLALAEEAGLAAAGPAGGGPLAGCSFPSVPFWGFQNLSFERDVVVPGLEGGVGACRPPRGRGLGAAAAEVPVAAAAEELHGVRDDLHRLALRAVLRVPLTPLEAPVDRDGPALREVLRATLTLVAPDGDVEVVRLLGPLSGRAVLAPGVDRDAQAADRHAGRGMTQLGIAGQVADEHDAVDVGCHFSLLSYGTVQATPRSRRCHRPPVRCRSRPWPRQAQGLGAGPVPSCASS